MHLARHMLASRVRVQLSRHMFASRVSAVSSGVTLPQLFLASVCSRFLAVASSRSSANHGPAADGTQRVVDGGPSRSAGKKFRGSRQQGLGCPSGTFEAAGHLEKRPQGIGAGELLRLVRHVCGSVTWRASPTEEAMLGGRRMPQRAAR